MDVCGGHGSEQQGHADPVVEPALDIETLADPLWHARLGDDRLAQGGVRRRQDDPEDHGLFDAQLPEERRRGQRTQDDRQRQPDPEQPHRDVRGTAQLAQVDA